MESRVNPESWAATVQVRSTSTGRIITGYAAIFYRGNSADQYQLGEDVFERIMPGCFDRALREKHDAICCINHDPATLLGRVASGTLKLSVDQRGLRYECTAPDTTDGRDCVELLQRGDIRGSSFRFGILKENWREAGMSIYREITDVILADVSPCACPAYPTTSASVRTATPAARSGYLPPAGIPLPEYLAAINQRVTEIEAEEREFYKKRAEFCMQSTR